MHCRLIVLLLAAGAFWVFGSDPLQYVPRDSSVVIYGNGNTITSLPVFQQMVKASRQNIVNSVILEEFAIVLPDPMKNNFFLFTETSLSEQELLNRLRTQGLGLRIVSGKIANRQAYKLAYAVKPHEEIYMVKLDSRVWLVSNGNPQAYFQMPCGLSKLQKKWLTSVAAGKNNQILLSGFMVPQQKSYVQLPGRVLFNTVLQKNGSLLLNTTISPQKQQDVRQLLMQMQQMLLLCGILINNMDPSLYQDFISSVSIREQKNEVILHAVFSPAFQQKFITAIEHLDTSKLMPGFDPAGMQ